MLKLYWSDSMRLQAQNFSLVQYIEQVDSTHNGESPQHPDYDHLD